MPTDPLTDDQARDLLHHAARSIDVAPSGPIVTSPKTWRRWAPALAAAVVVVIIGVSATVVGGGGSPAPVGPSTPATVPSVLGLTTTDAVARLEAAGLEVRLAPVVVCQPPGIALATLPGAGAPHPVNGRVDLSYNDDESRIDLDCSGALPERMWAVVAMLNGGPAVDLADRAARAQVEDVEAQVSGLLDTPGVTITKALTPCDDVASSDPSSEAFRITTPDDACGLQVVIERSGRALAAIRVSEQPPAVAPIMPILTGLPEGEARSAAGTVVDPAQVFVAYREAGCGASGRVAEQRPTTGRRLTSGDSVALTVDVVTAGCGEAPGVSDAERELARSLIGLAETDGTGDEADLAEQVELFVGHAPAGTVTDLDADAVDTWRGCPPSGGYSAFSCPVRLLGGVQSDAVNDVETQVRGEAVPLPCGGGLAAAGVPQRFAEMDSFFLTPPDKLLTCASTYRLQVFVDASSRIAALDLVLSEP